MAAQSPEPIHAGQLRIRYLVDGSRMGTLGVFELEVPPGSNVPPPHSHTNNEEIVYWCFRVSSRAAIVRGAAGSHCETA